MIDVFLALGGGVILGQAIAVLKLYWGRASMKHVVLISASYLIMIVLSMQRGFEPAQQFSRGWHIALALLAYAIGIWALWLLITPRVERPDRPRAEDP